MSHKIVMLGEIMLRLSTPGFSRFVQAQSFDVTYGGGEANVAVSLANYGLQSYFVTKLPANEMGQAALTAYRLLIDASRAGISHVPAIVFNERYVVYGVTDVADAVTRYEASQP